MEEISEDVNHDDTRSYTSDESLGNQENRQYTSSVEISDLSRHLANSTILQLDTVSPSPFGKPCCIYRVHNKFRERNPYAYTPEMVSIGPFHRHNTELHAMKDHKLRYMNALLSRAGNRELKLQQCLEVVTRRRREAGAFYAEPVQSNIHEFIHMLTVDGLFIIELFLKNALEVKPDSDDPLFNNIWGMSSLIRDLILVENQIPKFVLEDLYDLTVTKPNRKSLNELAIHFFNPLMHREEHVLAKCFNHHGKHLLDLLCKTFHESGHEGKIIYNLKPKLAPSLTGLLRAGVTFRKGTSAGSFLDIRFIDGVLEIPPILINDQTDILFRNMVAYEQICDELDASFMSYAILMDSLIDSANDVAFLRDHGIIKNYLSHDSNVSALFRNLCKEVTFLDFRYSGLCVELNAYCDTQWNVWRTILKRDYFRNPWSAISVVAAILLLLLTFTATLFSILSFSIHQS